MSTAWRDVRRPIILRLDNIGDVVMAAPALQAIKAALPDCWLTLMASPSGAQAAPLLPWVDEVVVLEAVWQSIGGRAFDAAQETAQLARLRARRHDGALVLTSFGQSPHPPAMFCRLAGIPLVAGASDEAGQSLTHAIGKGDRGIHQVRRNLDLVAALGLPATSDHAALTLPESARAEALEAAGLSAGAPFLLVAPWASASARTYDAGLMAAAAAGLASATRWPILLLGSPADAARTEALARAIGARARSLAGRTSLAAAASLVAEARLLVTVNTATMHLGDALGTPMVVLFAGTEEEGQWAPRYAPHRLLRRPTACSPCYAFTCPTDHACLAIAPTEVVAAALELLHATREG